MGIDRGYVEEYLDKPSTHWRHFNEYLQAYKDRNWDKTRKYIKDFDDKDTLDYYHKFIQKHNQYLKHHRIELNDVVSEAHIYINLVHNVTNN